MVPRLLTRTNLFVCVQFKLCFFLWIMFNICISVCMVYLQCQMIGVIHLVIGDSTERAHQTHKWLWVVLQHGTLSCPSSTNKKGAIYASPTNIQSCTRSAPLPPATEVWSVKSNQSYFPSSATRIHNALTSPCTCRVGKAQSSNNPQDWQRVKYPSHVPVHSAVWNHSLHPQPPTTSYKVYQQPKFLNCT